MAARGVVSKLLVLAGGAITLIGVVMLLVIAARAGLLNPQVRVGGGAALSVALIAAALRVHGRPGGSIGGTALAGTGIAGLFIVTVAMTSFYEWIPALGGLALAGAIAGAAGALAVRWRSELLAVAVTVAVAALAPVLTDGVTIGLVWFLVILQAAGIWPERLRGWCYLGFVRTLPAAGVALVYITDFHTVSSLPAALTIAALGVLSLVVSIGKDDELHTATFVTAMLPIAAQLNHLDRPVAILTGGAAAAALAAVAFAVPQLGTVRRIALGGVAGCLAIESAFVFTHGSWLPVLVLLPGLLVTAIATSSKSIVTTVFGLAFGVVGGAAYTCFANPAALSFSGRADADLSFATMVGGILLGAWAVLAAQALMGSALRVRPTIAATGAGVVGLYGATAASVSFGSSVAGTAGFHTAHLGVTVLWVSVAMFLMGLGIHLPRYGAAALGAGLLLTGCGIAKLFLFDLSTLGGATRAAAFIVVGLVLLFAGSRYAQAYARMRGGPGKGDVHNQPQPPAPVAMH
ncbi:DUF2339 domain-containing protein [Flexivirga alba]|uniref:DUF2339 domain-containing protein n=1 Tax=Flexivirga alba TaxID=702742 RepID=A0ABW2AE26_9MICO